MTISRIFCLRHNCQPLYRFRPTHAPEVAYSNVAINSTVIPCTIGVIFQARLVASYAAALTGRKIKLCNYLTCGPHEARGYRFKLQHQGYTEQRTTDMY